jgi:hypothetical protein
MKKISILAGVAVVALALLPSAGRAQVASYAELLRTDVQAQKQLIMTEALQLSDAQAEAFWPIYREYQFEYSKFGDKRLALIKRYAERYESFGPEDASGIAKDWFDQEKERLALLDATYQKIAKSLDPSVALRFVQVESALNKVVDLQVASRLPLIP